MLIAAFALSLVLVHDPEPAPQAAPQAPLSQEEQERAEQEAYLDEVVCRREHVVGSNRPQRICQTRRQWNHLSDLSREALRDDRFQTGTGRGPGESMGGGR